MKSHSLSIALVALMFITTACSPSENTANNANTPQKTANQAQISKLLTIDIGADVATLDPQLAEDTSSARVVYDLFEGLTAENQSNQPIAGLASSWEITDNGKTYTFHLRPDLKFSDGSNLTTDDVIFTFQRLAEPKTASPYNFLVTGIINGKAIIDGKMPATALAIKALNPNTIQIKLTHADPSFLAICAMPNLMIVSKANLTKFGNAWTSPQNMLSSGAYKLDERVVQGRILASKNQYYYAANEVAINNLKYLPIVDTNSSLNQYKSAGLDITYSLPADQYKQVKAQYPHEEHTVTQEAIGYYDFNMTSSKFKDNPQLRQALSMAVDREILTRDVLGQDQRPLYAYATDSIESGNFANLDYAWAKWPREKQITYAQQLFKNAGYGPDRPLQLSISYNTNDGHKKNALAIASMWQQVFGSNSIQVNASNMEWKSFLQARHKGDYDIARDGWVADYNSVDSYTNLFQCDNPQNNAKGCTTGYNELLIQAQLTTDPTKRIALIRQALQSAMNNYYIIPLYQYTYYRLVNPQIKNYKINSNHLDHVYSKWLKL